MKNNTLQYVVITVLCFNAATLLLFWFKGLLHDIAPRRLEHIIEKKLKLNAQQRRIYTNQHQTHHRQHDSLMQLITAQRRLLYAQKQAPTDSILIKIGSLQQEIERVTYQHFIELRNICSPEQQTQLDILLANTLQQLLMPKKAD